jgi:hypothetical protein
LTAVVAQRDNPVAAGAETSGLPASRSTGLLADEARVLNRVGLAIENGRPFVT